METRIYHRRNRIRSAVFIIGAVIVTGCGDTRSGQQETSLDRLESSEAGQPEMTPDRSESSATKSGSVRPVAGSAGT